VAGVIGGVIGVVIGALTLSVGVIICIMLGQYLIKKKNQPDLPVIMSLLKSQKRY